MKPANISKQWLIEMAAQRMKTKPGELKEKFKDFLWDIQHAAQDVLLIPYYVLTSTQDFYLAISLFNEGKSSRDMIAILEHRLEQNSRDI